MSAFEAELEKYIDSADDVVRNSIKTMCDIVFDGFNAGGCNGYVLFGKHRIFRGRVAVKYYYYGEDSHEEVALIKSLNHQNILHVWDAHIVGDGWAYFITDEMTNGTLDTMISDSGISTNTAIEIVRGLLSGLSRMHGAPNYLLHRDLKPANILIDSRQQPVIADFGSIKRMTESDLKVKASQHSTLYMPPESFDGGYYTIESDIYQIGMIMYQVLGGLLPYNPIEYMNAAQIKKYSQLDDFEKSKFVDDILYSKAKGAKLLSLTSLPNYTHPKLISIIRKATNPDTSKRYKNTADFFLDMHKLGSIPNWCRLNDEYLTCEFKESYYRVVKAQKGYTFEKSRDNTNWRRVSGVGYKPTTDAILKDITDFF